jgi:tRNA(Ile)-lysidine synthetase, N-terminal domain
MQLEARLQIRSDRPVAVALSGGGDSVALLDLVSRWARLHGRKVLALTVDHRLQAESADWSRQANALARTLGCDWRGLTWDEPTPGPGVTGRARRARHALLADAARQAGAQVLMLAHTHDDRLEAQWMRREEGARLGELRDWSPSPAWPEGRGLMLFRPLLTEPRALLRDYLIGRGLPWIEDPANGDLTYGRSRARQALAQSSAALLGDTPAQRQFWTGKLPQCDAFGGITIDRTVDRRALAMALVAASGGHRLPRSAAVVRLQKRLQAGEDFTATLVGARLLGQGSMIRISRQMSLRRGQPLPIPQPLLPGEPVLWDGRFEVWTDRSGLSVSAARGQLAQLSRDDRRWLTQLPAAERASQPVLVQATGGAPVLARPGVNQRCWVGHRLILALDQMTREGRIDGLGHGAEAHDILFSPDKR